MMPLFLHALIDIYITFWYGSANNLPSWWAGWPL